MHFCRPCRCQALECCRDFLSERFCLFCAKFFDGFHPLHPARGTEARFSVRRRQEVHPAGMAVYAGVVAVLLAPVREPRIRFRLAAILLQVLELTCRAALRADRIVYGCDVGAGYFEVAHFLLRVFLLDARKKLLRAGGSEKAAHGCVLLEHPMRAFSCLQPACQKFFKFGLSGLPSVPPPAAQLGQGRRKGQNRLAGQAEIRGIPVDCFVSHFRFPRL